VISLLVSMCAMHDPSENKHWDPNANDGNGALVDNGSHIM